MNELLGFGSAWFDFMLPAALRVVALLLITWAVVSLLRAQAAHLRSLIWTVGLTASLLTPLMHYQPLSFGVEVPLAALVHRDAEQPAEAPTHKIVPLELPEQAPKSAASKAGQSAELVGVAASDAPARPAGKSQGQAPPAGQTAARKPVPELRPVTTESPAVPTLSNSSRGLVDWLTALLGLTWMGGTLFVAGRFAVRLARQAHRSPRLKALDDGPWFSDMRRIADEFGFVRNIRLVRGEPGSSPQTWGVLEPTVAIPLDADMPDYQSRQAILRHELAHVARFDALRLTTERLMVALYWWNPLAWLAGRQAHLDREQACDDAVLLRGAQPSDYATQLLLQACGLQHPQSGPERASLLSVVDGPLVHRISRILDPHARRHGPPASVLAPLVLALVLVVYSVSALGVTAASGRPVGPSGAVEETVRIDVEGETTTIVIHGAEGDLTATIHGQVRFASDTEVQAISPGGTFTLLDERGAPHRSVIIEAGASGLAVTYLTAEGDQALDQAGRAWLDAALLDLFRVAGLDAPHRVNRIILASGAAGMLAEVEQIPSEYVRATYLELGMRHRRMDADGRAVLLGSLGQTVASEPERTRLLTTLDAERLAATPATREAAFQTIASLRASPVEQRRALEHVVPMVASDEAELVRALELAAGMQSDAELGGFLRASAPFVPGTGGTALTAWIDVSQALQSDLERGQAIRAMLRRSDATPAFTIPLIESSAGIESDVEKAQLLIDVVSHYRNSTEERAAYKAVAATIVSKIERERALAAL